MTKENMTKQPEKKKNTLFKEIPFIVENYARKSFTKLKIHFFVCFKQQLNICTRDKLFHFFSAPKN